MARRKQFEMEGINTREALLESGKKLFLAYGFQAAPLRKIASDAGFTSGALFGYFPSKEALFYALTDETADGLMEKLNTILNEIMAVPEKERLSQMCPIYIKHIPELVDYGLEHRDALDLIVNASKGTRYDDFKGALKRRNTKNINQAAILEGGRAKPLPEDVLEMLLDGYIDMLFRLVLKYDDRDTVCDYLRAIAYVYEKGILSLMTREESQNASLLRGK